MEDQNWDQCKIHAMPVYGIFRCRNLLVTIMYVCMYACIVIYFICTEISDVVSMWVVGYLRIPHKFHLYLSTWVFYGVALCSAPPSSQFPFQLTNQACTDSSVFDLADLWQNLVDLLTGHCLVHCKPIKNYTASYLLPQFYIS